MDFFAGIHSVWRDACARKCRAPSTLSLDSPGLLVVQKEPVLRLLKQVMAQAGEKKRVLDGMNPGVHSGMVAAAMGRWIDRAPNRTNETDQVIHEVMSRMPPLWQACWQRIGATASTDGIRVGREKLDRLGSLMTKRFSTTCCTASLRI